MKGVFLLTMAMARCVSEILTFCTTSVLSDGSLNIRIEIGFLAKNQLLYKVTESIKNQRLSNSCTSKDSDGLLIPNPSC